MPYFLNSFLGGSFYFIYLTKLINLFLALLGLCCSGGFSVVVVSRLLIVVASLVGEDGL